MEFVTEKAVLIEQISELCRMEKDISLLDIIYRLLVINTGAVEGEQ